MEMMRAMQSRRFALLAAFVVALNVVLWLAPQGLALRKAVINQLFGPKMIRAEVVVQAGGNSTQDYRLDRGVILSVSGGSLVLAEQDGTNQTIPVASSTRVTGPARFKSVAALRRGLRVLVTRQTDAAQTAPPAASLIQVEGAAKIRVARLRGSGSGD
jgi:hypothetical protein